VQWLEGLQVWVSLLELNKLDYKDMEGQHLEETTVNLVISIVG
jgi:hypothetical protein